MYTNFYILIYVYIVMGVDMSTEVLSIRIRRELKEDVVKLGINVKAVVERALEEEVRRVKKERFRRALEKALNSMDMSVEDWVKAVREIREER